MRKIVKLKPLLLELPKKSYFEYEENVLCLIVHFTYNVINSSIIEYHEYAMFDVKENAIIAIFKGKEECLPKLLIGSLLDGISSESYKPDRYELVQNENYSTLFSSCDSVESIKKCNDCYFPEIPKFSVLYQNDKKYFVLRTSFGFFFVLPDGDYSVKFCESFKDVIDWVKSENLQLLF